MQLTDDLRVRQMEIDDLRLVLTWAEQEGWNPIQQTATAFFAADPLGFFILEKNKKPIASLSKVKYNNGLVVLGLYIVDSAYRGQGYGKYLWDIVTEGLSKERYTELEGVVEQVDNYRASGFEIHATTSRYRKKSSKLTQETDESPHHITLTDTIALPDLIKYEHAILKQTRDAMLSEWLKSPFVRPLAAYNKSGICGYGQIAKAFDGYRIAPLYADDLDTAFYLYAKLTKYVEDNVSIYIDIPDDNKQAQELARLLDLEKTFETVRMYYKARVPEILTHKVFGKASLEIG